MCVCASVCVFVLAPQLVTWPGHTLPGTGSCDPVTLKGIQRVRNMDGWMKMQDQYIMSSNLLIASGVSAGGHLSSWLWSPELSDAPG